MKSVTQLLFPVSYKIFPPESKILGKESGGKAEESHHYLQHMCCVSPKKSIYTSAAWGRRGMGDAITTCLLRSLMLESHNLAKSHQLWQQELEQQQQPWRGRISLTVFPTCLSAASQRQQGHQLFLTSTRSLAPSDHGQINQATWTTPSQLWTARGSVSPVDSQS